jgi:hypothetical protein
MWYRTAVSWRVLSFASNFAVNLRVRKIANSRFDSEKICAQIREQVLYKNYEGNSQVHSDIQDMLKL